MSEQHQVVEGAGTSNLPAPPAADLTMSNAEDRPRRRPRIPFGAIGARLAAAPIPGFHLNWINDTPGRITRAADAGYDHVKDSAGKPISAVVGTAQGGGPLIAYLMKIPLDWYREDDAAMQARIDRTDAAIRRGQITAGEVKPEDREAFYASSHGRGIRMEEGTGQPA